MNKAAVYCKSCFFVLHRPSPRCNLGYVVVISLAHCHSHQCCFCGVVTFCSFSLLLSSLPFIHPSVQLSLEPKRLAERVSSQLEEIGELLCSVRPVQTVAVGQEMSSTEETPAADTYPRKILEYMEGFLISKALFTACELGVFDVLLGAERPLSAEEISQAVEASLDGTQRLLAACTGLQLLRAHQDNGQVFYSNTEQAKVYLTRSSPVSLFESIQYSSRTIYLCWHYLTDAVREGRNQYEKAFGVSSEDLFQALYRSDDEMMKFMQLMNSIWNICGRDVVTAFDLSPFKGFCDLGGCSGALAKQCTSAYPECTVTIFDLDKVVRMSREHFVSEADQRISFYEGDFFKDPLPEADLYILARILHDWSDGRCIELLRRVYEACKPGGAVLLVEALLHEDGSGPLTVQLYSLNMLVQTEGCERTAAQYAALLTAAGFTNIQHRLTGKIYDAVLAHKET